VVKVEPKLYSGIEEAEELLRPAEDTFDAASVAAAVRVTGHYTGWVEETARVTHGIPAAGFRPTVGGRGSIGSGFTKAGTSVVREKTAGMMRTNPNAYLYRHCFPGVKQKLDSAWTDDEIDLFVEVARKYGCGDKWGLFSSHIPGRVGYQCSNAYRSHILPQCLVIDPNYRFTTDGQPMYRPPGSKRRTAPKKAGVGGGRRPAKRRRRDYSSSEAESSSDSDTDMSDLASDDDNDEGDAPPSSVPSRRARASTRPQRTRRTPTRLTMSSPDRLTSGGEEDSDEILEKVKRASMAEIAAQDKEDRVATPPAAATGRPSRTRKPVERIRLSAFESPSQRSRQVNATVTQSPNKAAKRGGRRKK